MEGTQKGEAGSADLVQERRLQFLSFIWQS